MMKLIIRPNQLPDQSTQHIEEMSFIDFFGTFGGLLGLWLGISAVDISHRLIAHAKKVKINNCIL